MKKFIVFSLTIIMVLAIVCFTTYKTKDTILIDKKDSKMIAHRGLSGIAIENTEKAFSLAGEHSYYGIEADVRKTADGKFIICHDETLERLSGQNIYVEETTLDELLSITLSVKDIHGKGNLCELSTYVSICKNYDKQSILELKSGFTLIEIQKIIDIISSYNYLDRTTFISFSYTNISYVRDVLPTQSVQYLTSQFDMSVAKQLIKDKIDLAISYQALTIEYLELLHNAGLKVNCWTVDSKLMAERLASMGVDYITTNILE